MNTQKKKIIVIAPLPPPFGGISFIAKSLFDSGIKEKFNVIHLNTSKGSLTEIFGKITIQDIYLSACSLLKLLRICIKEKNTQYALIFGTNGSAIIRIASYVIILKIFRIKVITNLHGTRFYSQRKGVIKKLNNFVINNSELILSPTKIDMQGIQPYFMKTDHIRLFYNSTHIETKLYATDDFQKSRSELTIIGIGRLSKAKGAYDLLNTCVELLKLGYKIKLNWIGRGAFEADDHYANDLISRIGINIQQKIQIFRDVGDNEKYELLCNSDVFILPSYSENLPISILEAMAFGLPVISTNIGGIPEVIKENINGWLITPGDMRALKSLILLVMDKRNSFQDISTRNKNDFLEKFSTKQRIIELEEYLK